ncbi:MAG: hypothetical protein ABIG42_00145 [bacterium]
MILKYSLAVLFIIACLVDTAAASTPGKSGFAIGEDASVYLLLPSAEKKIHHFKSSGVLIRKFADEGPGEGQLLAPIDMMMYKKNLYVLDLFGPQIKVFSASGEMIDAFGKDFPKDQKLKKPLMMRIRYSNTAKKDILYILDKGNRLVMKYTLDGKFIEGIDLPPEDEQFFPWMTSFNVDHLDNLWFTVDTTEETALRHVLKFDEAGFLKDRFSLTKMGGAYGLLQDIIPREDGNYYIADSSTDMSSEYTGSIILFSSEKPEDKKTIYEKKNSRFYSPRRILIVGDLMYVLTSDDYLLKLTSSYQILHRWNLN